MKQIAICWRLRYSVENARVIVKERNKLHIDIRYHRHHPRVCVRPDPGLRGVCGLDAGGKSTDLTEALWPLFFLCALWYNSDTNEK